jgi:hypothetical protein
MTHAINPKVERPDENTGRAEEMLWISPTCVDPKGQSLFDF